MKKLVYILVSSLLIVTIVALSVFTIQNLNLNENIPLTGKAIYQPEDKPGCLSSAGYSWDEEMNACIRSWELDDNKKKAATIALEKTKTTNPTNIIKVNNMKCDGCYNIQLLSNNQEINVQLTDWEVE
jgi:hypothetical protein|tara:strand:- start:456 stop:839 length:384 start_codon:yes stop_codon:yes gene_type:complete